MKPQQVKVRRPAVAGSFYPDDAEKLAKTIRTYLKSHNAASSPQTLPSPKAVIVPHAGYVYSGKAAAQTLQRFAPDSDTITRIVLLGPCHRVALQGLAAPESTAFATPLGQIPIDQDALGAVKDLPYVSYDDNPHQDEHSLEVQLPIL